MIREYELTAPHRIDKVLRQPGYRFEIGEQTGDWMVDELGVAKRVDAAEPPPRAPLAATTRQVFDPPPKLITRCCGWNK